MDQSTIAMFKALYLRTTFCQAVEAAENNVATLRGFWKPYGILDCIKSIESAWDEVIDKYCKAYRINP